MDVDEIPEPRFRLALYPSWQLRKVLGKSLYVSHKRRINEPEKRLRKRKKRQLARRRHEECDSLRQRLTLCFFGVEYKGLARARQGVAFLVWSALSSNIQFRWLETPDIANEGKWLLSAQGRTRTRCQRHSQKGRTTL